MPSGAAGRQPPLLPALAAPADGADAAGELLFGPLAGLESQPSEAEAWQVSRESF